MRAGFVLTELLVAGLIASFLVLGLVQMAAGASRGLQLVESLSGSQQGGRFAVDQMRDAIMGAGYHPAPWASGPMAGVVATSSDGGPGGNDILTVQQFSDRNCYGNPNPVVDEHGNPAFFVRESTFERNTSANLAHTCYYGPEGGAMVRQVNRQGLVQGVESFQVLYAEDTNGDLRPERRVRAGNWNNASALVAVEVGLLLASEEVVAEDLGEDMSGAYTVLDESLTPASDGRLRRVWRAHIPLGGKLR